MNPDPSNPFRLPAPSPCRSCVVSKLGWITAGAGLLLAAFFYFRVVTARAETRLEQNNTELAQVEVKALKQQLYAERILSERQLANASNSAKTETVIVAQLIPPEAGVTSGPTAVAVWLPTRQSGILFADQLPSPGPDEELRLWIEEANSGPVNTGAITPAAGRTTKVEFKAPKPLGLAVRFSVTRERKDNAGSPSGPVLLSGSP